MLAGDKRIVNGFDVFRINWAVKDLKKPGLSPGFFFFGSVVSDKYTLSR